MKNNFLSLKDENGNKKDYRILLNIESDKNFVIYTDETKNENGDIKAYISTYELSSKGNMTKFKPVTDESEFDDISRILNSLYRKKGN